MALARLFAIVGVCVLSGGAAETVRYHSARPPLPAHEFVRAALHFGSCIIPLLCFRYKNVAPPLLAIDGLSLACILARTAKNACSMQVPHPTHLFLGCDLRDVWNVFSFSMFAAHKL